MQCNVNTASIHSIVFNHAFDIKCRCSVRTHQRRINVTQSSQAQKNSVERYIRPYSSSNSHLKFIPVWPDLPFLEESPQISGHTHVDPRLVWPRPRERKKEGRNWLLVFSLQSFLSSPSFLFFRSSEREKREKNSARMSLLLLSLPPSLPFVFPWATVKVLPSNILYYAGYHFRGTGGSLLTSPRPRGFVNTSERKKKLGEGEANWIAAAPFLCSDATWDACLLPSSFFLISKVLSFSRLNV